MVLAMLLAGLCATPDSRAQTVKDRADALLNDSKWAEAAAAYREALKAEPSNGAAWSGLGQALHQLKQFDEALGAYQKSRELKYRPLLQAYYMAVSHGAKGDRENAYLWLNKLADEGGSGTFMQLASAAPEFSAISGEPKCTASKRS